MNEQDAASFSQTQFIHSSREQLSTTIKSTLSNPVSVKNLEIQRSMGCQAWAMPTQPESHATYAAYVAFL